MRKLLVMVSLLALCGLLSVESSAQEKVDPADILLGLAKISLSSEYVAVEVDGQSWEEIYFEEDGMLLFVVDLDRTKVHVLKLTPIHEEFKPVELTIDPKDWKLAKLDKVTRQWQAAKKVVFVKWKPGEKPVEKVVEPPPEGDQPTAPPEESPSTDPKPGPPVEKPLPLPEDELETTAPESTPPAPDADPVPPVEAPATP